MVLQAAARSDNAMQEMRRLAKSKKNDQPETKKKPLLGTGKHGGKGNKEIPENELEIKVADIEFKRRQWLMHWQLEVIDMEHELYDMEQCLEKSIVRSESAKLRDKINKKESAHPNLTEEELEKLPIRMRPKPKYAPYLTPRQRTEINMRSYEKVMRNLHDNPRKFDVFTPEMGSNDNDHMTALSKDDLLHYNVLLMRNPFYKYRERDEYLLKIKMEPPWASGTKGIAPKKMVVSSRKGDPTTLPSLRPVSMVNGRENFQVMSGRASDKAVRFTGSQPHLPSIGVSNGAEGKKKKVPTATLR